MYLVTPDFFEEIEGVKKQCTEKHSKLMKKDQKAFMLIYTKHHVRENEWDNCLRQKQIISLREKEHLHPIKTHDFISRSKQKIAAK